MFTADVRAHWIASQHAARLMVPRRSGLIASTTLWDRGESFASLPYDLAKNAANRPACEMALELRPHGVASVAVSPGWMRTEAVLAAYGLPTNDSVRELPPELEQAESILYAGRAVAALAGDPEVHEKSGRVLTVGDLAKEYGFTDTDGRQPPPYQLLPEHTQD
jgi:NAD(P)-dependent dehydrogenase (short-subunit alcohol dehydrogenase family)